MRNTVKNIGIAGIVRDIKPQQLPSGFWTDGRNIRFDRQRCYGMGGVVPLFDTAVENLLNVGLVSSAITKFILYTNGTEVFSYDGTTTHNITRVSGGDYGEIADNLFMIDSFNGLGLLNNGIDIPQLWNPSLGSNKLVALSNWNSDWTTQALCQFKSFLIALNMTEGVNVYPHKMRWSSPAEAGAVPGSWDDSDPTELAGSFSFPDTKYGELVAGLELQNRFFIYKEGSIWAMNFIGGNDVFSIDPFMKNIGLAVKKSLVEVPFFPNRSSVHFFAGDENFFINNGSGIEPVFEDVFRREILKLRGEHYKKRAFSVIHPQFSELWFCIPQEGDDFCTVAFVLNYKNMTYTIRDLPGTSNIVSGMGLDTEGDIDTTGLSFSDLTYFGDGSGFYNETTIPGKTVFLESVPGLEQLYYLDRGVLNYDGEPYPRYVLRESLSCIKNDYRNPEANIEDYSVRKLVSSVVPKVYTGRAQLTIGVQEQENVAISWLDTEILPVDEFRHNLAEPVSGRFISFRFDSLGDEPFEVGGFDYEVDLLGEF